ncbi:MAG: S-methyl-5-thioribose-1-phosphate isomerase [Kyrpidia tusciae]|nr:S-methyl-5-thioribose-1-phosphate isomerase [Kyrpidia tusciae]MBE3553179.1 S-methyl-5-thioribose-1-phosphate isomerase [Kyrpidia tusciae]
MRALGWNGGELLILDQTRLPLEERWVHCRTVEEVAEAIEGMRVRGAPAIGVAAAFGVVLGAQRAVEQGRRISAAVGEAVARLAATRPTAVNLFWALSRMEKVAEVAGEGREAAARLEREAEALMREDEQVNRRIGRWGAELIPQRARILTHCNTGALATAAYGTALGVIRAAREEGKEVEVWVDETRPFFQGARLTAYELVQEGIKGTIITDSTAAALMAKGWVDLVIVGADRVAANGDVANKIGTYGLAIAARYHGIPFYVAAPTSTFDGSLADGRAIPIEERNPNEVLQVAGVRMAPPGASALHLAFDVTPHSLIDALITEKGVLRPPLPDAVQGLLRGGT